MKSEEFLDEGLGSWIKGGLARQGYLGKGQFIKQTSIDDRDFFIKDFVQKLEMSFNSAIQTNELGESINLSKIRNYRQFNELFETILSEAIKSAKEWLTDQVSPMISAYTLTPQDKQVFDALANEFESSFNTGGKKFPKNIATKIANWIFDVGSRQQRDQGRITSSGGGLSAPKTSTFGTPQLPTQAQWLDICQDLDAKGVKTKSGTTWIDPTTNTPVPLAFRDDKTLQTFQYNFSTKKWKNASTGQDVEDENVPAVNAMFVKKFNEMLAGPSPAKPSPPTSSQPQAQPQPQAQAQPQAQPRAQSQQSTSSIAAQSSEDDQKELQQMRAQVNAEKKKPGFQQDKGILRRAAQRGITENKKKSRKTVRS